MDERMQMILQCNAENKPSSLQEKCSSIFSESPEVREILVYIKLEEADLLKALMGIGFSQQDVVEFESAICHKLILRKGEYFPGMLGEGEYLPPFPKVLRFEPASACNFGCIHCPTGLGLNEDTGIMSLEVFDRIFKKIQKYHFRVIVMYHGGEPFLNRNLFEMAKRLRPLTDRIELNSNGSILTNSIITKLLEADVIDRLTFSFDGKSPEENNQIRKGSNFHRDAGNVIRLIQARNRLGLLRPRVFVANTQIPESLDQVAEIEVPLFLLEKFREVESEVSYKCTNALVWTGMPIQIRASQPNNNYCDHVVNTFTIRANGDVVACCYDITTDLKMGNVLESDPEEIWRNERFVGLRKSIASFNPPQLCQKCEVLYPNAFMTKADLVHLL